MLSNDSPLLLQDITAARQRIADGVQLTPCLRSIPLSELCGAEVFCKLEYLQRTGSFKERGARNALLLLDDAARKRGVIAASAGNHAQALAYHGGLLGIPVTVVMPEFAPLIKRENCKKLGARVILAGDSFAAARQHAEEHVKSDGLTYVHGYDDPAVIAGQGTLGLEVIEQVPDMDAIIVPVGGGGLLAGVSLAIKSLRPEVRVIGVESAAMPCFSAAMEVGHPNVVESAPTLADGLAIPKIGDNAFAILRQYVDCSINVEEEQIALAILRLMELEKAVVEGAGATPLAALLSGKLKELAGKRVVLVLAGGNVDLNVLQRLIEIGLVADGRLIRFSTRISDRPGGLAELASLISEAGASIVEVTHDRIFAGLDFRAVNVLCTVETRDREHIRKLFDLLECHGFKASPR
jgi:threonine dehydratase